MWPIPFSKTTALTKRECSTVEYPSVAKEPNDGEAHNPQLDCTPEHHQRECNHPHDGQKIIPWGLYDVSGARTPDSRKTMQAFFRSICGLRRNRLEILHTTLCIVPGVHSSGVRIEARGWKELYTVACQSRRPKR